MRRHFGIIFTVALVLAVLNAVGHVELDRPEENEAAPRRSGYNPGPTGTRAFYQLLAETGRPVVRWRESYSRLEAKAQHAVLIIVGPFAFDEPLPADESADLKRWLSRGGRALIVSRYPADQFNDDRLHAEPLPNAPSSKAPPDQAVDPNSDDLIAQPTELTARLHDLALSKFATRIKLATHNEPKTAADNSSPTPTPTPEADEISNAEELAPLSAPVVHLGDKDGAVLADFDFGKGLVLFLTDPFVIANNGIARGANLTLALNLVQSLAGNDRRIFFDEYHHGYRSESNPLVAYFRGTPAFWLFGQLTVLALLIVYSFGRRFARPLPLPQLDRHSPLEFVGSMANLQQAAQARELALANIYPRGKARLCRALGLSAKAEAEEIVAALRRRRVTVHEYDLRRALADGEQAMTGGEIDDQRLVGIVATLRRATALIAGGAARQG